MYRIRAREWQDKAAALPAGEERDAFLMIAEGYADLAALLEESQRDLDRLAQ